MIYTYDNQESSYIAALDKRTGDVRWREQRDEKTTWGTPFIWNHSGGTEIIQTGKNENRSYALNGELLWRNRRIKYEPVHGNGGSPVLVDDLLIFH